MTVSTKKKILEIEHRVNCAAVCGDGMVHVHKAVILVPNI